MIRKKIKPFVPKDEKCEHCGYCPHCGRRDANPVVPPVYVPIYIQPYQPAPYVQPYPYTNPTWIYGIPGGTSTGISSGTVNFIS